ncbi:hypothetical protein B5F36_13845 [Anaerofilum sp. An201]|nr:extracellular solute-binding protein [Anaerofilum sp. An201]OUP00476.1 hypothetical protein B5F36_13845 [Anaerofilum sp. An201]
MKKALSLALAAAMTMGLAACGAPSSTASNANSAASNNGDSGLSGTIVYWSMWQEMEPQAEAIKHAIEAFEKDNPNVTVEVEWQGRGVKDLVGPAIASGQQVDIFESDPNNIYKSDPSLMLDISDFYEEEGLNGKPEKENIMGALIQWDTDMGQKAGLSGNHSIPYAPYTMSWYYNKDMFADAGITEVPQTWEELDEACAKLKAKGYEPIVTDDAYMDMMFDYYLAREIGPDAVLDMVDKGGDAYNNEGLLNALKAMEDFASKGYFAESCKTNKYPSGQQQFARKEAAMYFNASFMASENAETAGPDFPYGHFAYPTVPGGVGAITENTVGGQAFMVGSKTENKEAVYALLHYLVGDDCQSEMLGMGLVPCTNDLDWPAAVQEQKPIVAGMTKNIDWAAGIAGDFCDGVLKPHVTKVMLGEETAQQAFDTIVAEAANYQ